MTTLHDTPAQRLARELYLDDCSRADKVPVEHNGHRAYDGWVRAMDEARDNVTGTSLARVDRDEFADAWGMLIDVLGDGRCHHYEDVVFVDCWGTVEVTEEEHVAACERATEWLTAHEGDSLSISMRPGRRGEIAAVYSVENRSQILGGSIPVPDKVAELIRLAYEHACETWPSVEAAAAQE